MNLDQDAHPLISQDEIDAVVDVLKSRRLSGFVAGSMDGGSKVVEFEKKFAEHMGIKHAISFNSCTSALHGACIACDVKPWHDVIVSPFTFTASVKCVNMCGAAPIFADIEPDTFCIDPQKLRTTSRCKAIIPVHLCGQPADMNPIMDFAKAHNMMVIEDAAQAIGAEYESRKVGTIGDCGVFSFDAHKTMTTGEGGMLITNNDKIAHKARLIRNHGEVLDELIIGYNYRLTEIQAALGIVQLDKLDGMNRHRQILCQHVTEYLKKNVPQVVPPVVRKGCTHVYFTYAVKVPRRKELMEFLKSKGIYFGEGYVKPLYRLKAYGGYKGMCPVAERMYETELIVTDRLRPPATIEDAEYIGRCFKEFFCR